MNFDDKEYSIADAEPFELYDFICGTWMMYLTSRATEFWVSDNQIYQPIPITHSSIRQGKEVKKNNIIITIPRGNELAAQFIHFPPENTMSVTIRRLHQGLLITDAVVAWKGRVISGEPKGETFDLTCESIFTSMRRQGPRLRCELICQHILYGENCKINKNAMIFEDVIITTNGDILTMSNTASKSDGWFSGGILEYEADSRYIISHVSNTLRISRPMVSLQDGITVKLYPGCDKTMTTCKNKFNNLLNNLSFAHFPTKNPFKVGIL